MQVFKNSISKEKGLNIAHASIVFLILMLVFTIWVHHAFQGEFWGPFLPGDHFGIPEREAEMGMYPTSVMGWDAQFYYYQSNDIFATGDGYEHIDSPPYRYQRIGVPLIASFVKMLLGYELTPPILYHGVQILLVVLAFYFLIGWLEEHKVSKMYAYGWLLSAGVLNSLAFGMPDPVGDAFFIMSVIFALRGQLKRYLVCASILLLIREGYAIFAAVIFLGTLLKSLEWNEESYWKRCLYTMLPGVIVILWTTFVTIRFGKIPMMSISGWNITDVPFLAVWKEFENAMYNNNMREILGKMLGVSLLVVGIIISWINRKRSFVWYAMLAYCLLTSTLGTTIWFDYSGYMKSMGSIIALMVIALPFLKFDRKRVVVLLLLVVVVHGVAINYTSKKSVMFTRFIKSSAESQVLENIEQPILNDFSSEISFDGESINMSSKAGLFSRFHRELKHINVKIKNTGNENWVAFSSGSNPVRLSYHLYNYEGTKVIYEGVRTELPKTLKPGESANVEMSIALPSKGEYLLRLSMLQEGVAWFYNADDESKTDIELFVE